MPIEGKVDLPKSVGSVSTLFHYHSGVILTEISKSNGVQITGPLMGTAETNRRYS